MSLHYQSLPYKGFKFEVKGIFTFQTFSSDLNEPDPNTNKASKWEIELYDVLDRDNKTDLDRLEELFLNYEWKNSFVRYGRIPIDETPLLNQRDGRMKPYAFEGFYGDIQLFKKWRAKPIIIHGASPRSTVEWFQMNEAIGLNNNGFTSTGEKTNYHHQLNTHFLAAQEISYTSKTININLWEWYLDKVFNLNWAQFEWKQSNYKLGLIAVNQTANPYQNKLTATNQFITPGTSTQILSYMAKLQKEQFSFEIAQSILIGNGRFVFPRELGRERLYTSITRSWADGLGKANIYKIEGTYTPKQKEELAINLITQFIKTAGQNNWEFNKYGVRDYIQSVFEVDYNFKGKFKGLELDLLYIYRKDVAKKSISTMEAFNKTNFHQFNFILNINF